MKNMFYVSGSVNLDTSVWMLKLNLVKILEKEIVCITISQIFWFIFVLFFFHLVSQ